MIDYIYLILILILIGFIVFLIYLSYEYRVKEGFQTSRDLSASYNINDLVNWPDTNKINEFDKNKIVYACINNNDNYMNNIIEIINNKNQYNLPVIPIPPFQNSIAGGFFIIYKEKINWWFNLFNITLERYFKNNYLVKDDQIILADCIFSNLDNFILDNPQIKLWTHGHTHEDFDYRIGSTRVVCNPRGYDGYEDRADNFELKFVEI